MNPDDRHRRFLPNVNAWQVRAGVLCSILVTLGGIGWGLRAAYGLRAEEQSTAFLTFVIGVVVGVVFGTTYAVVAAARHGSFFIDTPAEYERNRRARMGLGPTLAVGLAAATAIPLLIVRAEFVIGGALCGVMLAWTPLMLAAWLRFEWRRRSGVTAPSPRPRSRAR